MDLHTLNFEATPEPEGMAGGEGEDFGGEPLGEETDAWQGPSQDEWTQTQEALGQLAAYVQQSMQPSPDGQQQPIDPFSENFQEQLDAYIDSKTAPMQGFQQELQYDEAEQRAFDIITDITAREGEFLMPDQSTPMARNLAEDYLPSMIDRYGNGPKAAEAALTEAVKRVKEYEQEVGNAYHDRQANEIATLAGARRQPDAQAVGAQGQVTPEGGNEVDLVRNYFPS